jgi:hypothetical protein
MRRWREAAGDQKPEAPTGLSLKLLRKLHQTIAKVTQDFEGRWHFNTCVAAIMELVNDLQGADAQLAAGEVPAPVVRELLSGLVLLLAPFAPYLAAELWEELGEKSAILRAEWPASDPELAKEDELEIPGADQRQAGLRRPCCRRCRAQGHRGRGAGRRQGAGQGGGQDRGQGDRDSGPTGESGGEVTGSGSWMPTLAAKTKARRGWGTRRECAFKK